MKRSNMAMSMVVGVLLACALSVRAGTAELPGGVVSYSGARAVQVGGDLVLIYDDPAVVGTLTLTNNASARLLLAGGGGAGGTMALASTNGAAGGGGAGGFIDRSQVLEPGAYSIEVGRGGSRVSSAQASWVGASGGATSIRAGQSVAAVLGGGGGGAGKTNGSGLAGGSGGGGAWYGGEALPGGTGALGYGCAGGTPVADSVGGGGGGVDGCGGADGAAGPGRTSDITGTLTVYAPGGRGGHRGDGTYSPQSGAVPGAGGDGAVEGFGGAGHDGIAVVRISRLFDYQSVTPPDYEKSFYFTNGVTLTAFDLAAQPAELRAAIASVSGETSVVCRVEGGVTNGLGRHTFTLRLAEGYRWDFGDGETSTTDLTCAWRIKEEDLIGHADVTVSKRVAWLGGDLARIDIEATATPEMRAKTPEILVLGALCAAHGFSQKTLNTTLNVLSRIGNVDYKFYDGYYKYDYSTEVFFYDADAGTPRFSGHMEKGCPERALDAYIPARPLGPGTSIISLDDSADNHDTAWGFYCGLAECLADGTAAKYDFIVFSFDNELVANHIVQPHPREADVKDYLRPFYERGHVIWLLSPDAANYADADGQRVYYQNLPWRPGALATLTGNRVETFDHHHWLYNQSYDIPVGMYTGGFTAYRALMGLFSPAKYPTDRAAYDANAMCEICSVMNGRRIDAFDRLDPVKLRNLAGDQNPHQCFYDKASEISNLVERVVQPASYMVSLRDKICAGLELVDASGCWTTNIAVTGWIPLVNNRDELYVGSDYVSIFMTNVTEEVRIQLSITVRDTGRFRSSADAAYNERTGQWEKDPNDGPARIQMFNDSTFSGSSEYISDDPVPGILYYHDVIHGTLRQTIAEAEAPSATSWPFLAHNVTARVVTGPDTGRVVINGLDAGSLSVAAGSSPEVAFSGAPGYVLTSLAVDGQPVTDFDPASQSRVFANISSDHLVEVGFEKVDFRLIRAKQRYPWNNLVDIDYFIGSDRVDNSGPAYARIVFFVEYDDDDGTRVKKQLMTFRDNRRIYGRAPFPPDSIIRLGAPEQEHLRTCGYHRVTWDANADGVAIFQRRRVSFSMACYGAPER